MDNNQFLELIFQMRMLVLALWCLVAFEVLKYLKRL